MNDVIVASTNSISAINAAAGELTPIGILLMIVIALAVILVALVRWKVKQCEKITKERDEYRDELMRVLNQSQRQNRDT